MLHLALNGLPYFEISELEKQEHARNYTYTYYTLEKLKKNTRPMSSSFFWEKIVSQIFQLGLNIMNY